ncbi:N-acetylmuramoyl-L-alanine amidase [Paraburkholderia antibiotica]|uniref:N-acetylmuramoyl-L-alanine amidase n=1 Tax=Paraburkholderia antibiotica TaxID=2728839 RepID=A0A7Y0A2H2_9BURK|nr:N-acetylmuramoyl-L-alanine amidase [Paraburkholderia antibiotica]NML35249.1 N-acetylmuramoyl-L-alanine amidase [Paraburkholderia antibiotica]
MADYKIEHWTSARTVVGSSKDDAISISVNNRAATRQAIITRLKKNGYTLLERSSWDAKPPAHALMPNWDYHDIVIHHAGRSYSCAGNVQGAIKQMHDAQNYDMDKHGFDDIGYHYAVSCPGELIEARDIRFKGSHVAGDNTGKIGIVLLENLAERGEAWQQEYSRESIEQKVIDSPSIVYDKIAPNPTRPPDTQINALSALIATLKEYFNVTALGGHREYQLLAPGNEGRACPGRYGMVIVEEMRAKFQLTPPSK